MAKELKKLSVRRETVRQLTDSELKFANGGYRQNVLPPPTGCENTGIICEYSERTCCFSI